MKTTTLGQNDGDSEPGHATSGSDSQPSRWGRIAPILMIALAITLAVFGSFDVVERMWLHSLDMESLHLLHKIEGIGGSLVVAGVVSWIIIVSSPSFFGQGIEDQAGWQVLKDSGERARMYAKWFIAMRWLAVLLAAVLVYISVQMLGWLPLEVWWPLVLTVVGLAALNVLYSILVNRGTVGTGFLSVQVYLDLVVLTILLQFSGGIENPLSMMMIFHVIIGGILLSRRQCYWIAAAASGLFALMASVECADLVGHYTLQLYPHALEANGELFHPAEDPVYVASRTFLQAAIMFLTAYFVTTLADQLRRNERRLELMADRATAGQQLLEQALETTGAALRVMNTDLRPYWANSRWERWFGDESGNQAMSSMALAAVRQTIDDKQIRVTEVSSGELSGGENSGRRDFQITTAPLLGLEGEVHRIVELAQDVTQQRQTQEQMARAGKLAAVGELAGRVAHEVNNPIAIISAKSRLLLADRGDEMSPKIAEELGKITDCSDRVARIAQGLLSYCRMSPATRTLLDVRQPLGKSLAIVEEHARNSGVTIESRLSAGVAHVNANASELEQIFLNLFLNALDVMPKGGSLKVSVSPGVLSQDDHRPAVDVIVEDTGPGIAPGLRDRIFEPFFTTKPEGQGTGLGLSICLGLVRSHDGEIVVESEPGVGTRFVIKLPVADAIPATERNNG